MKFKRIELSATSLAAKKSRAESAVVAAAAAGRKCGNRVVVAFKPLEGERWPTIDRKPPKSLTAAETQSLQKANSPLTFQLTVCLVCLLDTCFAVCPFL